MTMTETPQLDQAVAAIEERLLAPGSRVAAEIKRVGDLNDALSASLQAPPEPDGPDRTLVSAARKQAGTWLNRVVLGKDAGGDIGAFRELQRETGCQSSAQIPYTLLDAAASTVTSSGDQENQMMTRPVIFGSLMTELAGVQRPMVGTGIANYPVVVAPTSGASVATIGTAVSDETVTIEGYSLSPEPLTVTATIGRDELSTFEGLSDDVLMTLRNSIVAGLDNQALNGTNGLMSVGTDPTPTTTVATFATVLAAAAAAVDGTYATSLGATCSLFHPQAYRLLWSLYRNQATDQSVAERLMDVQRAIATTSLMPAVSSDDSEVLHVRNPAVYDCAQPLWGSPTVTVDPYTLATSNQLRLTITQMTAVRVLRADNYLRSSMHLS